LIAHRELFVLAYLLFNQALLAEGGTPGVTSSRNNAIRSVEATPYAKVDCARMAQSQSS